jgi:hypothetical protein
MIPAMAESFNPSPEKTAAEAMPAACGKLFSTKADDGIRYTEEKSCRHGRGVTAYGNTHDEDRGL